MSHILDWADCFFRMLLNLFFSPCISCKLIRELEALWMMWFFSRAEMGFHWPPLPFPFLGGLLAGSALKWHCQRQPGSRGKVVPSVRPEVCSPGAGDLPPPYRRGRGSLRETPGQVLGTGSWGVQKGEKHTTREEVHLGKQRKPHLPLAPGAFLQDFFLPKH